MLMGADSQGNRDSSAGRGQRCYALVGIKLMIVRNLDSEDYLVPHVIDSEWNVRIDVHLSSDGVDSWSPKRSL